MANQIILPNLGYVDPEVFPKDWNFETISTLFDLNSGTTPRRSEPKFFSGKTFWITSSDLNKGIISDTLEKISVEAVKEANLEIFPKDTFVIALYGLEAEGTRGNCGITAIKSTINQACMAFLKKYDLESKYFFYFYLLFGNKIALTFAQGTKQQNLYKDTLEKIIIPYPSPSEQQKIIQILSNISDLINTLESLIQKKKNIKQGTMQELLTGKRRLEGFSEEWITKRLGDLLNYEQPITYLVKDTNYDDSYNIPVLTAGKSFILGYTNEEQGIFQNLPAIIFDDFTTDSKFVEFPFKVKSSAMKILKPKNNQVNLKFIFKVMQIIHFPIGDHKRYWLSEYQFLEIKIPKLNEQDTISKILSDMDSEIQQLEKQLEKYTNLKQAMMQKLLTGEIRLV